MASQSAESEVRGRYPAFRPRGIPAVSREERGCGTGRRQCRRIRPRRFFKTVMGRGLVCLLTKVIPIFLPVVWFSLVVMGMLPNPGPVGAFRRRRVSRGTWKVGRPYTNRYIHCPVRTAGRKVSHCGLPLVAPFGLINGITGLTWTVTVDFPYADGSDRLARRSLIFDRRLRVMLSPDRPHGCLMVKWSGMGQPDLMLKVNGAKRALSPIVEIDGCAGMPGVCFC